MKLPPQGIRYYDCTTKTKGGGEVVNIVLPLSISWTDHSHKGCMYFLDFTFIYMNNYFFVLLVSKIYL